jgi:anti-sigma B factor antagonist
LTVTASGGPVLRLSASRTGDTAVLRVVGEVDIATSDRLRGRLRDLLEPARTSPVRHLVVDAARLEFLDLTGLRVLLGAEAELRRRGGTLVVRSPGRRVLRVLRLLDPGGRLRVED